MVGGACAGTQREVIDVRLHISTGQALRVDSPVHRLDPRLKLVGTLAYMASCLFVCDAPTCALAGAFLVLVAALARIPAARLLRQVRNLAVFLIITSLINLVAVTSGPVVFELGPVAVHADGIRMSALYIIRFLLLLMGGSLLLQTTTPLAVTDALGALLAPLARLGAPIDQMMASLSIALRFVPTLARDAQTIVKAQSSRGARLEDVSLLAYARTCIPLAVPLFAGALRHEERLGDAMDARGYRGHGRSHLHVLRLDARRDGPAAATLLLYLAVFALTALG